MNSVTKTNSVAFCYSLLKIENWWVSYTYYFEEVFTEPDF